MKDKIPAYERVLSNLENKKRPFRYDSDEFIICLERIINGEIPAFELEIEKMVFEISKEETNLKIEIHHSDHGSLSYSIPRIGLAELKRMGFLVTEKNAVKKIKEFEERKILPTIELFSRIIYEVFRLYGDKKGRIRLKK